MPHNNPRGYQPVLDIRPVSRTADPVRPQLPPQERSQIQPPPTRGSHLMLVLIASGLALFCFSSIALLAAAYLYTHRAPPAPAPASAAASPSAVVAAVAKLTDLPTDESPQVVTISDLSPFVGQSFFAMASVGDLLLVYVNDHVAVLYDPSTNKIVNMSRISTVVSSPALVP